MTILSVNKTRETDGCGAPIFCCQIPVCRAVSNNATVGAIHDKSRYACYRQALGLLIRYAEHHARNGSGFYGRIVMRPYMQQPAKPEFVGLLHIFFKADIMKQK